MRITESGSNHEYDSDDSGDNIDDYDNENYQKPYKYHGVIESHFALSRLKPSQVPQPTSIEVTWSSSQLGNLSTLKPIPSGSKGEWKSETVTKQAHKAR